MTGQIKSNITSFTTFFSIPLFILFFILFSDAQTLTAETTPKAKAGDFHGTVILTGSLKAWKAEKFLVPMVRSRQIQIKWMVNEGEHVKPGDAVVRFDSANIADEIENMELAMQEREETRAQKLKDYNHQKFELEVALKEAEIQYQKNKIKASIPKGLETDFEYDTKQLELKKSAEALAGAKLEKKVKLSVLQSELKKLDLDLEEERLKLEKKQGEFRSLVLTAKTSGPVIYELHPWEGRKVQEGDNMPSTWTVATIPETNSLRVSAWVNETHIHKVREKIKTDLIPDAYPDRPFTGTVSQVLNSAEKRRQWGKAHYFNVSIELDLPPKDYMKPGMSVKCIVHSSHYKDVILIPLEAAAYDGKRYLLNPKGSKPTAVRPMGINMFHLAIKKDEASALGIQDGTEMLPVSQDFIEAQEKEASDD